MDLGGQLLILSQVVRGIPQGAFAHVRAEPAAVRENVSLRQACLNRFV